METYRMDFKTAIRNVLPRDKHLLSTEGPFIDAHFGTIDPDTPVGQTYFLRPLSRYNRSTKTLEINVNCSNYVTHFNTNKVTNEVAFCGQIIISDLKLHKRGKDTVYEPGADSVIHVDFTVHNGTRTHTHDGTPLPLRGFHIHDGREHKGLTGFGPISYFLYNTEYWNRQKSLFPQPLPLGNVIPQTDFVLRVSSP